MALVISGALGTVLLSTPFVYDDTGETVGFEGEIQLGAFSGGPWVVDTLPEALTVAAGGVVFVVVALNALNLLARLQARYTRALLGSDTVV